VTSSKRSSSLPDVPAIAETLPGFDVVSWQAIFAPAGVPKPIVERLSGEMIKAVNDPEIKSKLLAQGIEPGGNTRQHPPSRRTRSKWARVIKAGNIRSIEFRPWPCYLGWQESLTLLTPNWSKPTFQLVGGLAELPY
jgi:tripartite-type tricarboxylate transporter receptor subunit TctC